MAWDVFVAHAGPDKSAAEALYDLLSPHLRVFVDSRCVELGDDWDHALRRAQQQALMSVILVSSRTDNAYYEREEIAAAIALARTKGMIHRVIPVYLDATAKEQDTVPYGLRLKQGLVASDVGGVAGVAQQLIQAVQRLRQKLVEGDPEGDTLAQGAPFVPVQDTPQYSTAYPQMPPFVLQCTFQGDPTAYFVTAADQIIATPPGMPAVQVGRKIPPTAPGFFWMYQTPMVTYGVDGQGGIWSRFPNGMPFQVGQAYPVPPR
jgi:hypothetical protein